MLRKLLNVAFLTVVSVTTLAAAGCASDNGNGPNALTGDRAGQNDNWRYTDDKGHYRPEWRSSGSAPAGYPKGRGAADGA